jgi:hypothetical protein
MAMKDSCRNYRDHLVDAAEGRVSPEVAQHLEACASCAELVRRYREIVAATRIAWTPASRELVELVKGLMPETRKVWSARRLGSSLMAGARGPGDEFQMLVGTDELSVRVLASRTDAGWQLMGRFPEGEWNVVASVPVTVDANGFRFVVSNLEESAFSLVGHDTVLEVPALSRFLSDDGR